MRTIFLFIILSLNLIFIACEEAKPQATVPENLVIAYSEPLSTLSPLSNQAADRKYLSLIYEPLICHDGTFNLKTCLAVSWGRIDDLTWEIHLRQGVIFHDGSSFDANDVFYSIEMARLDPSSQLSSLLDSVESVEVVDEYTLEIHTKTPDVFLLNELTRVFIFPENYTDFDHPLGTGSYQFLRFENNKFKLLRFEDYWGTESIYPGVELWYIPNTLDRVEALMNGEVDVLANVPPQYVLALAEAGIQIDTFPSLEVNFLMLNVSDVFHDPILREAVFLSISTDYAEELGGGYLLPTDQFAASGIFGYTLDAPNRIQDLEAAKALLEDYPKPIPVTLDIPEGLEPLGVLIEDDLSQAGFEVEVLIYSPEDYEARIQYGDSDLYFLGWKYDFADLSDFFQNVIHSRKSGYGTLNGSNYLNPEVDDLIESLSTLSSVDERQDQMQKINQILWEDQVALPLFESQLIYGVSPDFIWNLRLDGQILPSDLELNVVE